MLRTAFRSLIARSLAIAFALGTISSTDAMAAPRHSHAHARIHRHVRAHTQQGTLASKLQPLLQNTRGDVTVVVKDLSDGTLTAVNAFQVMPAASVIKIPVMIEVFDQIKAGKISLNTQMTLEAGDVDHGWGIIDNDPPGKYQYSVDRLLKLMIDNSDNTATNMLIRLVGLQSINAEMQALGFTATTVPDYLRTDDSVKIRTLKTSGDDITNMLIMMAHGTLIDYSSSKQMLDILLAQHENTYMPALLPKGVKIAHKTGTLFDAVHDVGIVYLPSHAYVIAIMTSSDQDLNYSKDLLRRISRAVYDFQTQLPRLPAPPIPAKPATP